MRRFAKLLSEIEQTNSTHEKVGHLVHFFKTMDQETAVWALYFLSGHRPKKFISSGKLRSWAEELAQVPSWLSEDCYAAVGDTAEMVALMVAPFKNDTQADDLALPQWIEDRIEPLRDQEEAFQKEKIQKWWKELTTRETFVLNKLITGGLRIGVSEILVYRAIAEAFRLSRSTVAARLLGQWRPSKDFFQHLIRHDDQKYDPDSSHPYDPRSEELLPFPSCLAAPLNGTAADLGEAQKWQLEWKWDGIRAQVVKLGNRVELWSRGEERITEAFPDLVAKFSPFKEDFIVDGEILAGLAHQPGSFSDLQKRLNRKNPSAVTLRDHPVSFLAYDYLRDGGESLIDRPLTERRERLEKFVTAHRGPHFDVSPQIFVSNWEEATVLHSQARLKRAEGLMIKRKDAPYTTGRKRGVWFKWKVDPLTLDVVLTSAQPGTGRRASLYTDYTFSIWKGDQLVPIAKAYSGLTDVEIQEIDNWIRKNTANRFGPVRSLKPERVFEIGFEGVSISSRHKSGYAVRFPRILRERPDKSAVEADRVETVKDLLESLNPGSDCSVGNGTSKNAVESDLQGTLL